MNIENFKLVRDRIAAEPPEAFDMNNFICGTSMCIAGHTVLAMGGSFTHISSEWGDRYVCADRDGFEVDVEKFAAKALGLKKHEGYNLFYAEVLPNNYLTTRDEAVAALDAMIEAGSIYALVDELGNVREGV